VEIKYNVRFFLEQDKNKLIFSVKTRDVKLSELCLVFIMAKLNSIEDELCIPNIVERYEKGNEAFIVISVDAGRVADIKNTVVNSITSIKMQLRDEILSGKLFERKVYVKLLTELLKTPLVKKYPDEKQFSVEDIPKA